MHIKPEELSLYREVVAGERQRLPNGYWSRLGREGACALLRWKVSEEGWGTGQLIEKFQRGTLREWKLVSPASIFFNNVPLDYVRAAFPDLKNRTFGFDRAQVSKLEDFFDLIDTEEKAYFLGWMASDGNVTAANQISLWVGKKDGWVIDAFAQALKLRPYRRKTRKDGTVGVVVCSAALAGGLAKQGITPGKSYTIAWPNALPAHLESHFMRGLIDGDGSINEAQWTFATASQALLDAFKKRADAIVGVPLNVSLVGPNKRTFLLTGGHNTWRFLDFVYESATLALPRKRERYLAGKREIPVLAPICPTDRQRSGRRGFSVLVKCSHCGKEQRLPESRIRGQTYFFCDAHTRSERQLWSKNQGPMVGTSPYDEKLDDRELRHILKRLASANGGRLPSFSHIRNTQPAALARAIRARGGLGRAARRFGIETAIRSRGALDDLSILVREIDQIARELGRFPTYQDLSSARRYDVLNAISKKHGGIARVRAAWESRSQGHPTLLLFKGCQIES